MNSEIKSDDVMKERAYEIDVMKGVGILLVILGHCVPDFPVDLRADTLSANVEKFVYTFHMPLFFFLDLC